MRKMGLQAVYQRPKTTIPHPEHKKWPYLLRGFDIVRPIHVWCADITYIPMRRGFLYLVAVMDWASWRDVADRLEEPAVVEPVDPFEGRILDRFEGSPRPAPVDHLSFVEPVVRLGEGVVVGIPDTAHRGNHAGVGEAFGVADRQVLAASITVMDEAIAGRGAARMQGLLEGIEHEGRMRGSALSPTDDPPREHVDHEGDVDEAGPSRHVGEIRDPEPVRTGRPEVPIDKVARTRRRLVRDRRPDRSATNNA